MRRLADSFAPIPKSVVALMAGWLVAIWIGVVLLVLLSSSLRYLLLIPLSGMMVGIPLFVLASARKEPRNDW